MSTLIEAHPDLTMCVVYAAMFGSLGILLRSNAKKHRWVAKLQQLMTG